MATKNSMSPSELQRICESIRSKMKEKVKHKVVLPLFIFFSNSLILFLPFFFFFFPFFAKGFTIESLYEHYQGHPEKLDFLNDLLYFFASQHNLKQLMKIRKVEDKPIDLFRLFRIVYSRGGAEKVSLQTKLNFLV